jgi:LuxR family maltose regulon positive regulatory protein
MEAVDYALRAADFDRFAYLIERYAPALSFGGQMHTVLIWLNALPEVSKRARPSLYVYHAAVLAFTNHLAAAEECLQKAEHALTSQTPAELQQIILGQVAVIRGHLCRITGDMIGCLAHARQAVAQLPEVEHTPLKLRAVAMLDIARAFRWDGDVRPDKEQFALTVRQPIRAAGNSFALLNSVTNLAYLQTLQGRLRQAQATYQEALELVTHPDQLQYLFGGVSYFFGLGDLLREQNELDEAARYLAQGDQLVQGTISADADIVTLGYIALARLQQNQGNPQAANATLKTLSAIGQQRHFAPHLLTRAAAAQAQLWLAQNNLAAAANWADQSQLHLTDEVAFPYEPHYLVLVRIRLAQGRLEGIRPLLTQLQTAAAMQHRQQSLIEIYSLQALTHQAENNPSAALHSLQQALTLAAPEGYSRIFADEGEPMAQLLAELNDGRHPFIAYIHSLRQTLNQAPPPLPLPSGIDSLSEREMEVLHLIADGASNQEIAAALVVTISTVKKHVSNILSKLNTSSRTQAVAEARTLNLL